MYMPYNNLIYRFLYAIQTCWRGTRVRPPGIRPPAHSRILWLSTIINIVLYAPSLIAAVGYIYVVKS